MCAASVSVLLLYLADNVCLCVGVASCFSPCHTDTCQHCVYLGNLVGFDMMSRVDGWFKLDFRVFVCFWCTGRIRRRMDILRMKTEGYEVCEVCGLC
ncbi:hypothetical protein QBC37DRAFT_416184 [Rhypophila decipiens]|uniref:Secreted protein n=1 Tax=Rhypophila decipiens TaxID=261697 RepID=A0AAN7BAG0_9PEZI|nr:hypothetical protein QBC37DRAFT_416184 [Rhypophila decipiens]